MATRAKPDAPRRLIAAGADVNGRDGFGRTALHWSHGAEQTHLLLDAGADAHVRDRDGKTPLQWARDAAQIKALLAAGAAVPESLRNDSRVAAAQATLAAEKAADAMRTNGDHPRAIPTRRRRA